MSEVLKRAKLMARIAPSLLSAILHNHDDIEDAEALGQHFSEDINHMLPLAQILVEALKPETEAEHNDINALVAPVAAQLLARNYSVFNSHEPGDIVRLLKPSINVLVSYCDKMASDPIFNDMRNPVSRGLIAFAPVTACLTRYAFGKSPASRLTSILDAFARKQDELRGLLPDELKQDPHMRFGIQDAAAQLFVAHFESTLQEMDDDDDAGEAFKVLLQNWQESLSLFNVLVAHAALGDDAGDKMVKRNQAKAPKKEPESKVRALKTKPKSDDDRDDDEDGEESGGASGGGKQPKPYNPMSVFATGKKGM